MSREARLRSLLGRYVEHHVLDGTRLDPLELCREEPELLASLLERIEAYEGAERALQAETAYALAVGQVLGERYEVRRLLGRGGMGEVWLAYDLKLRLEVALKSVRPEAVGSARRRELLRREVRSAREVLSPHVCRVYDLVEEAGQELVSMEYVAGETLAEVLDRRGPLSLREAGEVAGQFLSGLEAIHAAGLVHRDLKPENVMLTGGGRVVVMDLGLAKPVASGRGTVAGTPAYMAPEQLAGEELDARADLFAAGVVLAEMIAERGSREALLEGIREDPPRLPAGAWSEVLGRAVAREREARHGSARSLLLALEEVTPRREGLAEGTPYPGLAAFRESDAAHFFGREVEVEGMLRKLEPPRLLALIGPSGAGKSSFVRAGLLPALPVGWGTLVCTPGNRPFLAVAQSLAPELAGDTDAIADLLRFDDLDVAVSVVDRWRRRYGRALLVVDQFEELFTQSPAEVQARFAELLGRLPLEAEAHVLLSLRDDFLLHCHRHAPLTPIFSDLTPIESPAGEALRRAVVLPAVQCGYRFEDERVVEEVLAETEGERGALPLLAFTMARLWERRDRDRGMLLTAAYRELGGVGGALARHAEATLERIGKGREMVVRELFRNLVTAQGTRASVEVDELLSVFGEGRRASAEEVLRELVDARLLSSFESRDREGEASSRRVEIIHESLLSAWPRLVRWQTQDEEGAQLRDELRQAARLWEEHDRSEDRLWTGTAYQEFQLWRERYPGGLSETEEAFADAMTTHAERRRRRRRLAVTASFAVLLLVLAVVGLFWRRSVLETRRAEAGKLLALGRAELETDRTAALAYARASLELSDTRQARLFALEVLWRGPVARILPVDRLREELRLSEDASPTLQIALSPDGRWLATRSASNRRILIFPRDGGPARALPRPPDGNTRVLEFGPEGDVLVTGGSGESLRFWSLPDLREIRSAELGGLGSDGMVRDGRLLTFTRLQDRGAELLLRSWPLSGGEAKVLGRVSLARWPGRHALVGQRRSFDPSGTRYAYGRGRSVRIRALVSDASAERALGSGPDEVQHVRFAPAGDRVASVDRSGEIRIWSAAGDAGAPLRVLHGTPYDNAEIRFGPQGRFLNQVGANGASHVWDLEGPPDSLPFVVGRPLRSAGTYLGEFGPGGQWLVTSGGADTVEFWPLRTPRARILRAAPSSIWYMSFTNDSRWLATCALLQPVRLWPTSAAHGSARDLVPAEPCSSLAMHPTRDQVVVGTGRGEVVLYSTTEGVPRRLPGGWAGTANASSVAPDPLGRRVLASPYRGGRPFADRERVLRVWDLESGQEQVYSVAHLTDADWSGGRLGFGADGSLYGSVGKRGNVVRLTLPAEPGGEIVSETIVEAGSSWSTLSRDGRLLLVRGSEAEAFHNLQFEQLLLFDLTTHTSRRIESHGSRLSGAAAFDPAGRLIVTGDVDGVVRVGPVSGGEPHLLLGHDEMVLSLAVSSDGRWIASATDASIRLWPMPDPTRAPLHTLPHAELMAKLDELTNLRVVRDSTSSTGWKTEIGPFTGWEAVPEW